MILYKYMSFSSACLAIENSSIGFSCLNDLNDPFEGDPLCFESSESLSSKLQFRPHMNRLNKHYGVLSLTRNPLNTLMWSHYGDNHRGVVIGIDTKKAGLNCVESCVIPANFGEMIYTSTFPRNELPASDIDSLMTIGTKHSSFQTHDFDLFKNAFLYKELVWNYEEEVRVVKYIKSPVSSSKKFKNNAGDWNQLEIEGRPLYCLSIPPESIVEVYLGCDAYKNVIRLNVLDQDEFVKKREEWKDKGINVQLVRKEANNWKLELSDYKI